MGQMYGNETPLLLAIKQGNPQLVGALLAGKNKRHVNRQMTNDGSTPLFIASRYGYAGVARILIQNGADVDHSVAFHKGATSLFCASTFGHTEVVIALIQAGASIDQATDQGEVPLSIASVQGHSGVVKALVD